MSSFKQLNGVHCPVCRVLHLPTDGSLHSKVYAATCQNCGHFFKFRTVPSVKSEITLTINNKKYTVGNKYDPATSLNEFLRDNGISMGTKYMCREGGCGLCVVEVKLYEPISEERVSYAINSCLCPIYMCDNWEVTTVEGVGNMRDGLHPIQSRLYQYNGSQCGFCSPAQVMNMHALLERKSNPSKQEVEDLYDGILCRCTGYRSILDAMKSFCDPDTSSKPEIVDIEDLNSRLCQRTGRACQDKCLSKSCDQQPVHLVLAQAQWFRPTTLDDLYDLMNMYKDMSVRLVFGGTGSGVYKDIGPWMYDILIDLHGIQELYNISFDPDAQIGANVTLSQMIDIFERVQPDDPDLPYMSECVKYMKQIAHLNVRNAGSWAGNLMMKHKHPEFQSDVFVMLETVGAQIGLNDEDFVSPAQLLRTDMMGKVITYMILPTVSRSTVVKFYKVRKRAQNAHAYVSGGFCMEIDKDKTFLVTKRPSIVYAGVSKTFIHAEKTEAFLIGKSLADPAVVKGAFTTLLSEVQPEVDPLGGSTVFRRNLTLSLLYRYILHVLGSAAGSRFRSGGTPLARPLSSGQQSYGTNEQEWPLTEPIGKLEGKAQVTGEAVYINDIPPLPKELYAAITVTTVANAKIQSVDTTDALAMHGVVKILQAADIPGTNNFMPPPYQPEEVLCSGQVLYAGQAVAIVIAEDEITADTAARAVKITYTDIKAPVLTIPDAIKNGKIFPKQADEIIEGDAEGAIMTSAGTVSGTVHAPTQYHFQLETQVCICEPLEDGMKVQASSQWIDNTQKSVAQVLGVPCASVDVSVKRLGGAYGSKISRNFAVSAACAVAANNVNRPVRLVLNFHTNMEMIGKRFPYMAEYQAGFTENGKLNGVKVTYYCDCGCAVNDCTLYEIMEMGDNAYYCGNWHMIPIAVQTNTASNTYCRAPASTPGIFVMETIMEHIAKNLKMDPTVIKQNNLYQKGQVTPGGMTLTYCSIGSLMSQLEQSAEVQTRQQQIEAFNKANRWKKKGLSVVPLKYGVVWNTQNYSTQVSVYSQDGTVSVAHGGVEVGQGINTKIAQVCAYEFGISVDMVKIKATNTLTNAGSCFTGSSVTSELCCQSAVNACQQILARMAPVRKKMTDPTWLKVVQKCYNEGIDLAAHGWFAPHTDNYFRYNSYGVTCTEVELDVLTGEHQILRVDMLFDCGESVNPFLDIGQVEGAFVMGLGYWLLEESIYDSETGQYLTNSTWDYKPPTSKDIPIDFRIKLLKDAPNPLGILRSKACGEPPLCMSCSSLFALKHAVEAALDDQGQDEYFPLNGPATVEKLQNSCHNDPAQFVIQ